MTADEDYANERLEAMKEEKEQEVSDLKAKLDNISSRQAELKSTLYARRIASKFMFRASVAQNFS